MADVKSEAVNVSASPGSPGAGSPTHIVAELQFDESIGEIEYRISYLAALPVVLSSPGAVQSSMIELDGV
jgi:hypothetical protein